MMFAYVRVRSVRGLPPLSFTSPEISRATWGARCVRARICLLANPLAGRIFAGTAVRPTLADLPFPETARFESVAVLASGKLHLYEGAECVHFQPSDVRFGVGSSLSDFAIHGGSIEITYLTSWTTFLAQLSPHDLRVLLSWSECSHMMLLFPGL